ncbi:MAG: hypothetical protein SGI72_00255 [Planctomycetota bacterium]|mgnify:CR=1 FL=1|nr:hypothetical protein [Planctomycetota bacterium]
MNLKRPQPLGSAVLAVDRECVEWLFVDKDGKNNHAVKPVAGAGIQALADAASAVVREAGTTPGRCVLALGQGLVRQKLITLPVMSRRETRTALRRKAAGMCECDVEQVAFTATCFEEVAPAAGELKASRVDKRWLVTAVLREETRDLRAALAKVGFKIARTVSSQISTLARGQALRADKTQACIVVSALRKSASVGLIHGDTLVNENVLEGDMRAQPTLAMSLVQEIKSFDAAWRKANRGGAVGQVVLIGLPRDRAPLFKAAVNTALPNALVLLSNADTDEAPGLDHGRIEALDACRESGGLQSDLTLPIPLQPKFVSFVLIAIFASLCTVATIAYRPARKAELLELEAVLAANARTFGLDELRLENAAAAAALVELDRITARNADVLAHGWKFRTVVTDILGALGSDAALIGLELGPLTKAEFEVSGVASPDPATAMLGVDRVVKNIEESPRFEAVVSSPTGTIPTGVQPIAFKIQARLEGQR